MRVAGIGFRQGAPLSSLRWVLEAVEAMGGPAEALASLPEKALDAALCALAAERNLPLRAVAIRGIETPTRSARIMDMHGTGSVAEAAALAAAGPNAKITVTRIVAPDALATCAMAETEGPRP